MTPRTPPSGRVTRVRLSNSDRPASSPGSTSSSPKTSSTASSTPNSAPATLHVEPGSPNAPTTGLALQLVDGSPKTGTRNTITSSSASYFDARPRPTIVDSRSRSSSNGSAGSNAGNSDIIVATSSPSAYPYRFPISLPSPWDWATRSPLPDGGTPKRSSRRYAASESQKPGPHGRPSLQSRRSIISSFSSTKPEGSIYSLDE